jgi:hypothetical protein
MGLRCLRTMGAGIACSRPAASAAWFAVADPLCGAWAIRTETGEPGELEKLGIWDELIMK